MGDVLQFKSSPHVATNIRCTNCNHEWIGVVPLPVQHPGLECPKCNVMKGVLRDFITYEGQNWHCGCDGLLFSIHLDKSSNPIICCASCGCTTSALELFDRIPK